jgi:hypothetical protein
MARLDLRFICKVCLLLLLSCFLLAGCSGGGKNSETISVENVAALRKVDGKKVSAVITAGYHYSGDGCGFTYVKDTTSQKYSDNGGSVIVGEDGTCWRAVYETGLPLKVFGAIGDGNINFAAVAAAAADSGVDYMLVEQDDCHGEDPFSAMKRSYDYLKAMGLE